MGHLYLFAFAIAIAYVGGSLAAMRERAERRSVGELTAVDRALLRFWP